jgi:hypothetical protein
LHFKLCFDALEREFRPLVFFLNFLSDCYLFVCLKASLYLESKYSLNVVLLMALSFTLDSSDSWDLSLFWDKGNFIFSKASKVFFWASGFVAQTQDCGSCSKASCLGPKTLVAWEDPSAMSGTSSDSSSTQ